MSDKNNLYSSTHFSSPSSVGCDFRVMAHDVCGTSQNAEKESDESNTKNNCLVTHLRQRQHSNNLLPLQKNEKKHHNFDQAFDTMAAATYSWRQKLLCHGFAKIKILFLFFTTLLSSCVQLLLPRNQPCHYFIRAIQHQVQKLNYTKFLSIPQVTLLVLSIVFRQIDGISGVKQSHFVHWNTSNPIFRIDNTDHIIDVNHGNKPWEYDQVNIICPVYPSGRRRPDDEIEKYIIYSVTKEEYETCRITNPNPKTIAICNKPYELMYFTITFRSFTPTPGGMEFKPGRDYYFISTSSKHDLYRRVGGHCSTHHMKLEFKIADNNHETHSETKTKAVNVARPRRPMSPYPQPGSSYSTEDDGDTVIINTSDNYNYKDYPTNYKGYYNNPQNGRRGSHPTYDRNSDHINSYYDHSPPRYPSYTNYRENKGKKRKEYDVHPNDVIKHEASRMAAATSTASNYYIHCDANKMVLFISIHVAVVIQMMSFGFLGLH